MVGLRIWNDSKSTQWWEQAYGCSGSDAILTSLPRPLPPVFP
jgi:hypothetical protein